MVSEMSRINNLDRGRSSGGQSAVISVFQRQLQMCLEKSIERLLYRWSF